MGDRMLVNNPEMERTVLSVFLQGDNASYYSVEQDLDENLFYTEKNKRLYLAIKAVVGSEKAATPLAVATYLSEHHREGDPDATEVAE